MLAVATACASTTARLDEPRDQPSGVGTYPSPGPSGCHAWEPGCNELGICLAKTDEPVPCGAGAEQAIRYRYRIYAHCGIRWAWFGGGWWKADPIVEDAAPYMELHSNNVVEGTMTLVAPGVARFEAAKDLEVAFRPDAEPTGKCA